jgi:hypothetical protein
MESGKFN